MVELESFVGEWDMELQQSVSIPDITFKELAERYAAGETIQRLAADTGVPYSALRDAFDAEGVDKIVRKPPSVTNAEVEELAARYRAGESLRNLVAGSRFRYTTIRTALNAAGVEMRVNRTRETDGLVADQSSQPDSRRGRGHPYTDNSPNCAPPVDDEAAVVYRDAHRRRPRSAARAAAQCGRRADRAGTGRRDARCITTPLARTQRPPTIRRPRGTTTSRISLNRESDRVTAPPTTPAPIPSTARANTPAEQRP